MPELTLELFNWENLYNPSTKMSIAIDRDQVVITGRPEVIRRAVDLALVNYVEVDGFIRAALHDR